MSYAIAHHHVPTALPDFVTRRMDLHHITRIQQLLGGEHPHAWQPTPAGAVFLAGNDYLCLAGEPVLVGAQIAALQHSAGELLMSAVYLQEGSPQHRLERKLAQFMGAEDGILAQSGWAANVGLVQTLTGPGIPVYLDMQAHASLWEGVQSAGAIPVSFLHNDMEHLQKQLQRHGRGLIVVDALYSTNGSLAPLAQLVEIAERSGCMLLVDESHSLGTHGPRGAGLVAAAGLSERVHFRTASLAKAFAGRAGFITCSSHFKGYFLSESRPAIFSSCLLGHELAWFDAAIDFIAAADDRRAALHAGARELRDELSALGYNVSDGSEQIIALEPGPEPKTLALRKLLERQGVYGAMFCAPATPKNRSLVRLTLNSGLGRAELARIVHACDEIRSEADLDSWSSTRRLRKLALV
ncbi:CAI-1 autoinducer synthase [Duganella sp. CF402]|uniref:alpha-hydroxyketone-type quorum-sensing autoinducer synthase n=1 Tax=unclassified Duganella TaxID=2636909 RepID=UPI0008D3E874|nr:MULTISPECIES: alpha-hydroxyketone-type quorum-sensing autoinducer synthase [unclassified Duganella]RZT08973.1 CAI-1 autoinducer synthase [Duganella sp. BK701]SEL75129.1 CAI-1 autoinducer synthase [Duganella sp. CF402]